jgi:hypothetical protein
MKYLEHFQLTGAEDIECHRLTEKDLWRKGEPDFRSSPFPSFLRGDPGSSFKEAQLFTDDVPTGVKSYSK